MGRRAVLRAQFRGQGFERVGPAGGDDQVVAAGGEPQREFAADAAGRAGNQGERFQWATAFADDSPVMSRAERLRVT